MTIPFPPADPRDPDDLAEVRAADRLNAWLDGYRPADTTEPPLVATAHETARLAATGVPARATRAHEHRLWEDLMHQHRTPSSRPVALAASSPAPVAIPSAMPASGPRGLRRPNGHPFGRRVMGMVATLTLVALVGMSAVAVYLNAPRDPAPPTMSLAGAVLGTPSAGPYVPPTPVRADATAFPGSVGRMPGESSIWGLPDSAFDELPPATSYGDGWHTFTGITLLQQPDTSFQIETRYYVDGDGARIRIMLVRYIDDAQFDEAYAYFADEIQRYQDTVYFFDETARTQRLAEPLAGCNRSMRAEGLEWVTSFPIQATLCRSDDLGLILLVSVSGSVERAVDLESPQPADVVVTDALAFVQTIATPIP